MMGTRQRAGVVALDVGGTSVKSAVVVGDGQVIGEPQTTPIDTQGSADVILTALVRIIESYIRKLRDGRLLGVAFGFPGPFEYEAGISRIQGVAKFESIFGLNIRRELQHRLGMDNLAICFRNDAEAAIVGEALYGAGRPFTRLIGVTLGTGCGSAFLVNGQPVSTGAGVPPNGWLYPVPFRGQQADDVFSIRGLMNALQDAGVEVDTIKTAADVARQDNVAARRVFAQFGHHLGVFMSPWAEAFQAEAILLQGGITNAFDLFKVELTANLPVAVTQGELGAQAALHGAAALFLHNSYEQKSTTG
jgi:glucokinase